ncbi:hypothetical protein GCM10022232_27090 [Streptomyces plumbiresistens]|uniref:Uncharacterized protein n=1 Tax=Streptomyces plumbiresistens TaxID=511811 RepID=A0ABP7R1V7_9ACTN
MIPSVARSGPLRDHVRLRERGYLRVPCPKPAIINSLNPSVGWVRSGFDDASTPDAVPNPPALRRAAPLRQRAADPVALIRRTNVPNLPGEHAAPEGLTHCDLRRVPGARNL